MIEPAMRLHSMKWSGLRCVEILSPSNTQSEIDEKRALYFDAG
jgi:hypothetical protein